MKPDTYPYRSHGEVDSDRRAARFTTVLFIVFIVLAYALAYQWDQASQAEDRMMGNALRAAAQLSANDQDWALKVRRAYTQGQRDALRDLKPTDAMAVAQVCQAWRYRNLTIPDDSGAPQYGTAHQPRNGG